MQHVQWMKKGMCYLEWENGLWEMNNRYVINEDNFCEVSLLTCLLQLRVYKSHIWEVVGSVRCPKTLKLRISHWFFL